MNSVQPAGVTSITDTLERIFGDLPLYEAEIQLHLIPSKADSRGAKKLDPYNCALSRCCKRLFGSTAVAFFGYYAYVDSMWRGKRILQRYTVPKKTRDAIDEFDKTGVFPIGGFILYPPSKTQTLEHRRKKSAERRAKIATGVIIPAETHYSLGRNPSKPSAIAAIRRRNGHGLVHTRVRA